MSIKEQIRKIEEIDVWDKITGKKACPANIFPPLLKGCKGLCCVYCENRTCKARCGNTRGDCEVSGFYALELIKLYKSRIEWKNYATFSTAVRELESERNDGKV